MSFNAREISAYSISSRPDMAAESQQQHGYSAYSLAHTRTSRRFRVSCTYRQLLGLPERSTRRLKHTSAHEQLETAAFWGQACEWAV